MNKKNFFKEFLRKVKNTLLNKNNKKKIIIGGIITVVVIILIIFLCNYNRIIIKRNVNNYFNDLITLQFDDSQKYLDKDYNFKNNDVLSYENYKLYISKWKVDVESIKINKKVAVVELKLYNPSMIELLRGYASKIFSSDISKDDYYKQALSSKDLKYDTFTGLIVLNKINHKWKIANDNNLSNVLLYGANNTSIDINKVSTSDTESKNDTKLTEEDIYIAKNLQVTSYNVKEYDTYSKNNVPGVGNISLKNNGDKDIKKLTVTIYFQDENGKNIAEDSFLIIGGWDYLDPLKANYSWSMEDDKFYEFENLPSDIDINRNTIKITEIEFDD